MTLTRWAARRTGVGTVLAVAGALGCAIALPSSWTPSTDDAALATAAPVGEQDVSCRARAELAEGLPATDAQAEWVRLCPNRNGWVFSFAQRQNPRVVLTEGVDKLVDGWVAAGPSGPDCPYRTSRFRIQVGHADGRVHELQVRPAGCQSATFGGERLDVSSRVVFGDVLSRMGAELEEHAEPGSSTPPPLTCPRRPLRLSQGSLSRTGFLIPLPADESLLCRYQRRSGPRDGLQLVENRELPTTRAERLRVAYHSREGGIVDCSGSPRRPVFSVVMDDVTGERRIFTVDQTFCGTTISDFGDFGLAYPWLGHALHKASRYPIDP